MRTAHCAYAKQRISVQIASVLCKNKPVKCMWKLLKISFLFQKLFHRAWCSVAKAVCVLVRVCHLFLFLIFLIFKNKLVNNMKTGMCTTVPSCTIPSQKRIEAQVWKQFEFWCEGVIFLIFLKSRNKLVKNMKTSNVVQAVRDLSAVLTALP